MNYKLLLLSTFFLLTACGFQPMYANNPVSETVSVTTGFSEVEIGNIPDRNGQILRNRLVDRMQPYGLTTQAVYKLNVTNLRESIRDLDITIRSDTTREQMKITADMELINLETGEVLLQKDLSARGSYNILENEYTSRVSKQDLREDLLIKISTQIERYIALYLSQS